MGAYLEIHYDDISRAEGDIGRDGDKGNSLQAEAVNKKWPSHHQAAGKG